MKKNSIAMMIYGEPGSNKNVFTEEKYKKLAAHFVEKGFDVDSVCYHDSLADWLSEELKKYAAILVWVNPIEQQGDRTILDALLRELSEQGCFVSAHPDTIIKMGTKEILYKAKGKDFGMDVKRYHSFEEFREKFPPSLKLSRIRILKQYRGNGGKGVFKIDGTDMNNNRIGITHAAEDDRETIMSVDEFLNRFAPYFETGSMLIDQQWNPGIINGMVRCYISGNRVAGFGYQEINALYPKINSVFKKPSQRFYFSEACGLFRDLKEIMEKEWITRLQEVTGVQNEMLPLIWDADFFINKTNTEKTAEKYSLCEINVSSVSPFPESSIPFIVQETKTKLAR